MESPHRTRLLAELPVRERRLQLAGVNTSILEGGGGPALLLLHGPGEFGAKWLRVIPELVNTHRVIAPDLPGHGQSIANGSRMDDSFAIAWLRELIERCCPSPPVLVGHVLGGAIATRFAIIHPERIARLVLVDSLGLARFRPTLRFGLTMMGFLARPTASTYTRFMRQCSFDLDRLKSEMADRWSAYEAYNLELAQGAGAKAAGQLMRNLGLKRIPPDELARIRTPTTLIWGRHDRATRLAVAQRASERYGWPLHVIEHCADDPPRDEPKAFLKAVYAAIEVRQPVNAVSS